MRHPEHYAAVQREVDEVLGNREPTLEDLPRLGFTLQAIKEALRLYPPGYLQGRAPLHDVVVDGFSLRKDEMILLSNYVLHRDAEVFPEPERFLPERFLPEAEKQRPRTAYMPFGIGPFGIGRLIAPRALSLRLTSETCALLRFFGIFISLALSLRSGT